MFEQGSVYRVAIDRKSNAGNWIASIGDAVQVRKPEGESRPLSDGEVWQARYIGKENSVHVFQALSYVETIENPETVDTARQLAEMADVGQELEQDTHGSAYLPKNPPKSPVGSMNDLLSGKKH